MQLGTSTITSQGQVSVPLKVRQAYGLLPGTRFAWEDEDGELVIRPIRHSLDDFARLLPAPPAQALSLEAMEEALASRFSGKR